MVIIQSDDVATSARLYRTSGSLHPSTKGFFPLHCASHSCHRRISRLPPRPWSNILKGFSVERLCVLCIRGHTERIGCWEGHLALCFLLSERWSCYSTLDSALTKSSNSYHVLLLGAASHYQQSPHCEYDSPCHSRLVLMSLEHSSRRVIDAINAKKDLAV